MALANYCRVFKRALKEGFCIAAFIKVIPFKLQFMSITYKIIPRKNPQDLTAPAKYYAAVTANGSVDFETLQK